MRRETQTLKGQYQPRSSNLLQTILAEHIDDFSLSYEEHYAADYGRFSLNRIADCVDKFLECGDYSLGMARIKCTNQKCDYEYFRPFSCKQWYLCPSCHQKRLLLFSERMNQETLLKLPHRQFVFTVPKALRPFFRHDKKLFAEVSRLIALILTKYYSSASGKELDTGVVSAFQTYGDMLRFNPHWHCIVLEGGIDEQGRFFHVPRVDLSSLCEVFRQAVMRLFKRLDLLQEKFYNNMLSWKHSGFTVDDSVRMLSGAQKVRESLSQYISRHPVSLKKIHYVREKSQVLYLTKYNQYFGENVKLFTAVDFIAELTQHIPPKGKHLIRYYGLYSSRTKGKDKETGRVDKLRVKPREEASEQPDMPGEIVTMTDKQKLSAQTWARLISKVYEVDPLVCPHCQSPMAIVAVITDSESVRQILNHLRKKGLPPFAHSPPVENKTFAVNSEPVLV